MPIVTVETLPQSKEKKEEIAKIFTSELSRITGIPQNAIVMIFRDVPPENMANGGVLMSERYGKK